MRSGIQWVAIPMQKSRKTFQYAGITSRGLTVHSVPIRVIIEVAMFQAVSLATAGSRFEPDRKKSRVKVMKVKVTITDHATLVAFAKRGQRT